MTNIKIWNHNGKTYRMIGRIEKEKEYGYIGYTKEQYNVLQVKIKDIFELMKKRSIWEDVEKEHVPNHVLISIGALGSSDWKSKLHEKCRKDLNMI